MMLSMSCLNSLISMAGLLQMIESMQKNGCNPDAFTYSVLIDACGKTSNKDLALKVYKRAMREVRSTTDTFFLCAFVLTAVVQRMH